MADDAKLRSTTALNRLWDGGAIDRIRAAEKFVLIGRRVSAHLQAQHDVAMTMIGDRSLQDNGFLSRWLMVAPVSMAGTRFSKPVSDKSKAALATYTSKTLAHLRRELPYAEGKNFELAPRVLKLSDEAKTCWRQFADHIEKQVGPDGDLAPIAGLANKLPEHAARIAGVLTIFENERAAEIDLTYLNRGIEIAQHYAAEALRLSGAASITVELASAQQLLNWLHSKWTEEFIAIKPLVESGPNSLRDTKIIKRLVATLADHHWVEPAPPGTVVAHKPRREAWKIIKAEV